MGRGGFLSRGREGRGRHVVDHDGLKKVLAWGGGIVSVSRFVEGGDFSATAFKKSDQEKLVKF